MSKTIIVYENKELCVCNDNCANCSFINCENRCQPEYFKELKKYWNEYRDDRDNNCGFYYDDKKKIIKFSKYTGLFQLKDGTFLEILPKISSKREDNEINVLKGERIFQNLVYASHNLTKSYKDSPEASQQTTKKNKFLEIFISVFCEDLNLILRKGIKKSYINREENLTVYKGKIKFNEHLKNNSVNKERFFVEYDDFSMNTPENRIIKSACIYLLRQTGLDKNKKILRRMLIELDDVEICNNLDKDLKKIQITRLNQYYQRPLDYAEFFLRKQMIVPQKGKTKLKSLLFPLNEMFEDYIENILKTEGIKILPQYSPHYLVTKEKSEEINEYQNVKYFKTKMDFVILKDDKALILDAKWKIIDTKNDKIDENNDICNSHYGVAQSDLYQLFAYSEIIKKRENKENVSIALLYPQTSDFDRVKRWKYFNGTDIALIPVNVENPAYNEYLVQYCR